MLVIANIEKLQDVEFFVAILYDDEGTGQQVDSMVKLYEGETEAQITMIDLLAANKVVNAKVYTSNRYLYKVFQPKVNLTCALKHQSETAATRSLLTFNQEAIADFYIRRMLESDDDQPRLSWWRRAVVRLLEYLLMKIKGDVEYGIQEINGIPPTATSTPRASSESLRKFGEGASRVKKTSRGV